MKITRCDTCKKSISEYYEIGGAQFHPTHLISHGIDYDFCDLKCLWKFVTVEWAKENPRTNIEFGKEK